MFTNEIIATFNELELLLYNYISKNKEKVVYMRIRDLANETHVSTSTILRFCRKLDCEGFTEFKVKLKLLLEDQPAPKLKSSQHVLEEFFERTQNEKFENRIKEAAQLIAAADNVIFIGIGSSGILAEYGARYFSSMGKFSLHIKDPFMPIHANYLHNSITIALSVSGEGNFTISQTLQLKDKGSKVISITNNKQSTIAKLADLNLSYYVTEEFIDVANVTTQIPVIYILEEMARRVYELSH